MCLKRNDILLNQMLLLEMSYISTRSTVFDVIRHYYKKNEPCYFIIFVRFLYCIPGYCLSACPFC